MLSCKKCLDGCCIILETCKPNHFLNESTYIFGFKKVYVSEIRGPNRRRPLGRWKDKVKQYESVCERGAT